MSLNPTNATKAGLIALANALLGLLIAFGVGLSNEQQAAVLTATNALLAVWVALTYKDSPKRIREEP